MRRCRISRPCAARLPVWENALMGHVNRTARKPLEVTIMFEPSRLAAEHLADAYRQLVPLRTRTIRRSEPEVGSEAQPAEVKTRRRS